MQKCGGKEDLHPHGGTKIGRKCAHCGLFRVSAFVGWFSHVKLGAVSALGLLWTIVEGIPYKFAMTATAKGVSAHTWSLWVRSVGEVLAESNERARLREAGAMVA